MWLQEWQNLKRYSGTQILLRLLNIPVTEVAFLGICRAKLYSILILNTIPIYLTSPRRLAFNYEAISWLSQWR